MSKFQVFHICPILLSLSLMSKSFTAPFCWIENAFWGQCPFQHLIYVSSKSPLLWEGTKDFKLRLTFATESFTVTFFTPFDLAQLQNQTAIDHLSQNYNNFFYENNNENNKHCPIIGCQRYRQGISYCALMTHTNLPYEVS